MKRKQGIMLVVCLFLMTAIMAVPAFPESLVYRHYEQNVTVRLMGDERVKWAESEDGYSLMYDRMGYLVYAKSDNKGGMEPSDVKASDIAQRKQSESDFISHTQKQLRFSQNQISLIKQIFNIHSRESAKEFPSSGNRKLVMLLIGFTDKSFSKTKTEFINLMNQTGYSFNNASGSVKDWFLSNSFNQLNLSTDVYGPYQAAHNMAYYGANDVYGYDVRPRELVLEAINSADSEVDFSEYDNDDDGYMDGIYLIYAGYGEEAGASSNAIWAHAWSISPVVKDGVYISSYSCSPELSGNSGTNITNIGVICHEFSHVCGLPDFYDTDYSGSGGQSFDLKKWDPMASGSWNNNGKTPPHHNCYSKTALGWQNTTILNNSVSLYIPNSHDHNVSYRFDTSIHNEYFMLENRQKSGWDLYIPHHGLLIYHVDKNLSGWNTNDINVNPAHQGMDIEEADNIRSIETYSGDPFPGTGNVSTFTDESVPGSLNWNGQATQKPITNICETDGIISLDFMGGTPPTLPVTLSAFNAVTVMDQFISLSWVTQSENNMLGYHLYRSV
ncbi:MAG: M6 family metalloprotease domain-containing protein, partial [Candidatus Cloacimonetes bacterium]|nr:M6 family metalloprotease domain-containing protein [Candidatus Cloacimonadota bacterium]